MEFLPGVLDKILVAFVPAILFFSMVLDDLERKGFSHLLCAHHSGGPRADFPYLTFMPY